MPKGLPYSLQKAVREGHVAGRYRITVNRVVDFTVVAAAAGFFALELDALPSRELVIQQATASLAFESLDANLIATFALSWALGSAPTPDVTLPFATTEQDMVDTQTEVAVAGTIKTGRAATPMTSPLYLANDAGVSELNLNMVVAAASITDDTTAQVRVTGHVDLLLGFV